MYTGNNLDMSFVGCNYGLFTILEANLADLNYDLPKVFIATGYENTISITRLPGRYLLDF